MEIEYKLYNNDIVYDEMYGSIQEKKLITFINNYSESEYTDILKEEYDTFIQDELSTRKNNLFNWYEFNKDSKILQVIGKYGCITSQLIKGGNKVTCIETIKERAEVNNKRNCTNNLKIICTSKLFDLELDEKFDYIVLTDVIENSQIFMDDEKISKRESVKFIIDFYYKMLNENGKLIIITENKYALKSFAGHKNNEVAFSFYNLTGKNNKKFDKPISKNCIINILNKLNINNYKFYYPLPDYKNASVIYSDDLIPSEYSTKLKYNIYYNQHDTIIFNENDVIKQIVKDELFDVFANSYVIEISNKRNNINFIAFNNFRKEEYRLITKIKNGIVEKTCSSKKSQEHLNDIKNYIDVLKKLNIDILDYYDEEKVYSKFVNSRSFDEYLMNIIDEKGKNEFLNEIKKWYKFIYDILQINNNIEDVVSQNIFKKYGVEINQEQIYSLSFTKNGFFDMVFENIFFIDNKYNVYDQEWCEYNVPIEFILYRALQNLYFKNNKINDIISKSEIFDEFGIGKFCDLFENLENRFQEIIVDQDVINYYNLTYERITSIEDLEFYHKLYNEKCNENELLKSNNNELFAELEKLKNSKYYKFYDKYLRRKK